MDSLPSSERVASMETRSDFDIPFSLACFIYQSIK